MNPHRDRKKGKHTGIQAGRWLLLLPVWALILLSACREASPVNQATPPLATSTQGREQAVDATAEPSPFPTMLSSEGTLPTEEKNVTGLEPTPAPEATASATPAPATPTAEIPYIILPTVTPTPRPEIPLGAIRILRPASLSRATSPLQVRAIVAPGAEGVYRIELFGEDGRLLARQVLSYPGIRVNTSINLDFEIPGVAEVGRLQISTQDEHGRVMAMNSSTVLLMSVGRDEYLNANDLRERLLILQPTPEERIVGGTLTVTGKAWPTGDEPLLIELIAENGAVVGQRLVAVEPVEGEDYGSFTVEVPYRVQEATPVRLTVYEDNDRIPGKTYIYSLEITINP
jgi:hypothetical protein